MTDVVLPPGNVDWELEVVAVVGRGGFKIDRVDAWDALAGRFVRCGAGVLCIGGTEEVAKCRG